MSDPFPDVDPEVRTKMQRAAHDVYVLQFLVDDLWRDYNSLPGGRDVLMLNRMIILALVKRLTSLVEKIWQNHEQSESSSATGCD